MSDDIITVIARLSNGFERLNLEPPEAIVLKSFDDGMRFWSELCARLVYRPGREPGVMQIEVGSVMYMELQIYGMRVRWPAQKWVMPDSEPKWG